MAARTYDNYNYGSTAPAYDPSAIRKARERYARTVEKQVRERQADLRAEKASLSPAQIVIFVLCFAVFLATVALYMVTLSEESTIKKMTEQQQTLLCELQKENALTELSIEENTDYAEIYRYATEDLGMQLPEKQQVVTYGKSSSEYVVKKAEIPNEAR